jgi:type I restriction enzyme S subunit
MSEWKEIFLRDVCTEISYGYTASATNEITGVKFLRITDIVNTPFSWDTVPYCEINSKDAIKYKLYPGDIVIARTGATTGSTFTISDKTNAVFASYLIRYKIDTTKANPYFIGHNLKSEYWKGYVENIIGGSAQPGANAQQFAGYELLLPPLPEQERIAEVLSSLDDKIDLLHRQNTTLEQMAETLFRQWFVEEAEDNWETCNLENLCITISSGGTPSTKESSYYNGNINWYSTKELNDNFLFESSSKITPLGLENSSAKLFPAGTVLIAIYAAPTVGRLGILATEGTFNQAACGLVPDKKKCSKEFLYLFLKSQREELNQMATGSAQQNLNVGKIKNYPLVIPTKSVFDKLKFLTEPLFQKIQENTKQVKQLEQTRDTLLPKLMNGSVRVKCK